jgi:hypothetical protein
MLDGDRFVERHGEIWLIYSDSTCWEVFAKDASLLGNVRDHLRGNAVVRTYETTSGDRGRT